MMGLAHASAIGGVFDSTDVLKLPACSGDSRVGTRRKSPQPLGNLDADRPWPLLERPQRSRQRLELPRAVLADFAQAGLDLYAPAL